MSMKMTDYPITNLNEDSLSVKEFVSSLATTIIEVETPYSISVYGEWGSGKTSILKIVENIISEKEYKTLWLNAWEIYTLAGQDELRNLFVSKILSLLFPYSKVISKIFSLFFKTTTRNFLNIGNMIGNFSIDDIEKELTSLLNEVSIQNRFKGAISIANKIKNKDRIVIFVDDLDRLNPLEVLTILDAVSVFFNIGGCIFIFALDHLRINDAIEKMHHNKLDDTYPTKYLDKVIQLNINIPVANYDIKKFITEILELNKIDYYKQNIIDNYTSLTLYSIGKIPRNIKKICSKFYFYKKILQQDTENENTDYKRGFYPFRECFLHQALFAMLCFQESYEDIYNLFIQSNGYNKEFILEIINSINDETPIKYIVTKDIDLNNIKEKYMDNKSKEEKLLRFLYTFLATIEINESKRTNFSSGGRYLITKISKIIRMRDYYEENIYSRKLSFSIKESILNKYFNRIFKYYLTYLKSDISCKESSKHIEILFKYACGPFSFVFHIEYKNNIMYAFIENGTVDNHIYKETIKKWIENSCRGLPQKTFIPHERNFIQFEKIFYYEYTASRHNPFRFFINTSKILLCSIIDSVSYLNANNSKSIKYLCNLNTKLKNEIINLFPEKKWIVEGEINTKDRWNGIMISQKSWNGKLHICIEPEGYYMQRIIIGIRKSTWNGNFMDNADNEFYKRLFHPYNGNIFKHSAHWIVYKDTWPKSFSEGEYYPGIKIIFDKKDTPLQFILDDLNMYKRLSYDIGILAQKALY